MATTDYWAEPTLDRAQTVLFSPTLDSTISEDDPVRLVDEVLGGIDWSSWEAEYDGSRGQPAIHPRYVAAAILYGMYRGIRSSRRLEEACTYRLDFIWLVQGRKIDHTTFAKFRTKFAKPLKDLFRQIGRIAMTMGLIRLCEVAFDGTRVKANNSRYKTRTAKTLQQKLEALDELFDEMVSECEALDAQQRLEGQNDSPTQLPGPLADLQKRREKVREAFDQAKAADEARRKNGTNPEKNPAQVPTTDPESRVMPNKEGGYAPNYTPTATTDGHRGFIVDCDVVAEVNEGGLAVGSVDRIEEDFGEKPKKFLTDGGNNDGSIQQQMEERGVEFYAPVELNEPQKGNPARRDDPTQPVPESQRSALPRNSKGQLDKSCFVYNEQEDQYYCPQGKPMPFDKTKPAVRSGVRMTLRVYRSRSCDGCPLATACLSAKNKQGRTITRDGYEKVRQRTAARMASESGRELYNQRPRIAETTFGVLKFAMGIRQFLLRGLDKVKTEWLWAATSLNLRKLVNAIARMRAEFSNLIAEPQG